MTLTDIKAMKTILYARVSTTDQTVEHQRKHAVAAGFKIDEVVADEGVSGLTTALRDRAQGKRLFDLLRHGDVLVVRWLDRLGRNYKDVSEAVRAFMDRGVIVKTVINGMTFDGSTADPMSMAVRDALLAFMAATGQAQADATKEAQRAGIAHAREIGARYLGRKPSFDDTQLEVILSAIAEGRRPVDIARECAVSRQTVYRIKGNPEAAAKALAVWQVQ